MEVRTVFLGCQSEHTIVHPIAAWVVVGVALPNNNGGIVSVTVPSKTTLGKGSAGHLTPAALARRERESGRRSTGYERFAADLERPF